MKANHNPNSYEFIEGCRTASISGDRPILIVAPHGHDDPYTAEMAEWIAHELSCYAVINYGWKRAKTFDYDKENANCNSLSQIQNEVVHDEFYVPFDTHCNSCEWVFIIHGVSNEIRKTKPAASKLDLIIGYGKGTPNRFSCPLRAKNQFLHYLDLQGFDVFQGKRNGKFSGHSHDNLNQFGAIDSMQIEIVKERRKDLYTAINTAELLASAIEDLVEWGDTPLNEGQTITNHPFPFI